MKVCKRCGLEKLANLDNFRKVTKNKDGLSSWCKECFNEYNREWRQDNPTRVKENHQRWVSENPEYYPVYTKVYYIDHKEQDRKRNRKWIENNRSRMRELKRFGQHKRRARIRNAEINDFTAEEWEDLKYLFDYRCAYCCKRESELDKPLEPDHLIPISRGGNNTMANIAPACKPCNNSKNNKTRAEFIYSS